MHALSRKDLYSLEEYAGMRDEFRARVMTHKKRRQVHIGPMVTFYFEDRLTMQYQVQEMLRIERIFETAGIQDELDAYNPLIPDGSNWKATCMIEIGDEEERRRRLAELIGIEDRIWVQVDGHAKVWAIADEDLDREDEEKTSSVHFIRFELEAAMIQALKSGAGVGIGIAHPAYDHSIKSLAAATRDTLVADLD